MFPKEVVFENVNVFRSLKNIYQSLPELANIKIKQNRNKVE